MNIQQQTTSEVAYIETVVADNEELDPRPLQDTPNVFAEANFSSSSSSDSSKYTRAWLKGKAVHYYILSSGECTNACSR